MGLRQRLDELRPYFQTRRGWRPLLPIFESVEGFLYPSPAATSTAPHLRHHVNAQRLDWIYVLASAPTAVAGLWWPAGGSGFTAFVTILTAALMTAATWEWIFAHTRGRRFGHGVFLTAWLFALIAPPALPTYQVVLAVSFGFVFGRAVFGGAGRHIVSPSLLALVFLYVAFPATGGTADSDVLALARSGGIEQLRSAGHGWWDAFVSDGPSAVGSASAAAGVAGAALLVVAGAASWRIMLGCVAGLLAASLLARAAGVADLPMFELPWHWHLALGGFVFGVAFLATDAACSPMTNGGRWIYGVLTGALVLLIRAGGGKGFEPVAYAILFAGIVAPIADFVVVERHVRRRIRRAARQQT